jgi:competence protein ComEC
MPLTVHFLNVGRGDCTIIEFPSGRVGMVDIDNLKSLDPKSEKEYLEEYRKSFEYQFARQRNPPDALRSERNFIKRKVAGVTDPFKYYDRVIGSTRDVFRMIITHPDMDHMTGLYRLHELEPLKDIVNFWHVGPYDFNLANTTTEEWASCPYDRRDWVTYKKLRRSGDYPRSLQVVRGDGYGDEDGVEIWAPTEELKELALERGDKGSNIVSMVLKLSYRGRSILLGGDATCEETWPHIYQITDMTDIDVLKASHHGRRSGYYGPAVKEMSPWLTITSVAARKHDATENYRRYSEHTVSLRDAGDIAITIGDDGVLYYPPHIEEYWKEQKI